jgi:CRP-like cAMP-binding protein
MLCAKLRRATELLEDQLTLGTETRLARALLRFAREYGVRCPDSIHVGSKLSQRELGGIVGVARGNGQLAEWRARGILRIDHGRITLCRLDALEAIADAGS